MSTLKWAWKKLRRQVWFIPSAYGLAFFLLALATATFDALSMAPSPFHLPLSLGREILSTLAAALLTMTTITFSTIMVVLTTYTSQFSPRTLEDFVTNTTTQRVLGVFLGGFVYALSALYLSKDTGTDQMISATVGAVIALVCLGFFAYFIHHVATSIQVNRLIDALTRELLDAVEGNRRSLAHPQIQNQPTLPLDALEESPHQVVRSGQRGYLQGIDVKGLVKEATKRGEMVRLEERVGARLTTGTVLYSVWPVRPSKDPGVYRFFLQIDRERSMSEDLAFGLKKLVEIALRALSPGINDPNTAILCIHNLAMILSSMATADMEHLYFFDEKGLLRLIRTEVLFSDLLYESFSQIQHYGKTDPSIMAALLDAVRIIAEENTRKIDKTLKDFTHSLVSGFDKQAASPLDLAHLKGKLKAIDLLLLSNFSSSFE